MQKLLKQHWHMVCNGGLVDEILLNGIICVILRF